MNWPEAIFAELPVVNTTNQIRAFSFVRWSESRSKIMWLITPVICGIIEWTVSSVKLLNNVVVGNGTI